MKKLVIMCALLLIIGSVVSAQGNLERLEQITDLEGVIEISKDEAGQPKVVLILDDGTEVELQLPESEQLMFKNQERIKLEGVLIGPTAGTQIAHQLFVRAMNRNGIRTEIGNPIQLSEQQRQQQKAYLNEQQEIQNRVQNQNQLQLETNKPEAFPGTGGADTGNTNDGAKKQGGK